MEVEFPLRVLTTELAPDSAGAGRHRGGLRGRTAAVVLNPGRTNERRMRGKEVGNGLEQGDVWLLRASGGGGYGPPRERDPRLLESDIEDGYVTGEGAAADHGLAGGGPSVGDLRP